MSSSPINWSALNNDDWILARNLQLGTFFKENQDSILDFERRIHSLKMLSSEDSEFIPSIHGGLVLKKIPGALLPGIFKQPRGNHDGELLYSLENAVPIDATALGLRLSPSGENLAVIYDSLGSKFISVINRSQQIVWKQEIKNLYDAAWGLDDSSLVFSSDAPDGEKNIFLVDIVTHSQSKIFSQRSPDRYLLIKMQDPFLFIDETDGTTHQRSFIDLKTGEHHVHPLPDSLIDVTSYNTDIIGIQYSETSHLYTLYSSNTGINNSFQIPKDFEPDKIQAHKNYFTLFGSSHCIPAMYLCALEHPHCDKVVIPSQGTATLLENERLSSNNTYLRTSSFNHPSELLQVDESTKMTTVSKQTPLELKMNSLNISEENYTLVSHDGVPIPITFVHRAGVPLKGVIATAYGAYDQHLSSSFKISMVPLLEDGFGLEFVHVRGSSECGINWKRLGQGEKKPFGIEDFDRYIESFSQRYNNIPLFIRLRSAGGIFVTPALNLFASKIRGIILEAPFVSTNWWRASSLASRERNEFGSEKSQLINERVTPKAPFNTQMLLWLSKKDSIIPLDAVRPWIDTYSPRALALISDEAPHEGPSTESEEDELQAIESVFMKSLISQAAESH